MVSPTKGDKGTTRSHFVWQHYLKSFTNKDGKLFVKDKLSGNIFPSSTTNAAVSKSLYVIESNISDIELSSFKCMLKIRRGLTEEDVLILNELVQFLNNDLDSLIPDMLREQYGFPLLNGIVKSKIVSHALERNQEELFTFYENNFLHIYNMLRDRDSSFYNNLIGNEDMLNGFLAGRIFKLYTFLHKKMFDLLFRLLNELGFHEHDFIAIQTWKDGRKMLDDEVESSFPYANEKFYNVYYFLSFILTQLYRTNKVNSKLQSFGERLPKEFDEFKGIIDFKNITALFTHFQPLIIAENIIGLGFKIVFIINESEVDFITSDHPVINIYGIFKEIELMNVNDLELYYPINSRLAIFLTNRDCYANISEVYAYSKDVKVYNNCIYQQAENFVYASNSELLRQLL